VHRCRDPGFGLGLGDRLAHLTCPPQALTALQTSLKLFDANPCVNTFAIFYEEGGQDRAGLVGLEIGHQALGGGVGPALEGAHDRAERAVGQIVGLGQQSQERRPGLRRVKQERHEIALDGRR
jgi:hypothetical protein